MLSRNGTSAAMGPCWYTRRHTPAGARAQQDDGSVTATCRHCGRRIRSRERGRWVLAEGIDLDALQERSRTGHFCVIDTLDGIVIARYPIAMDADEAWIREKMAQINDEYAIAQSGGDLQIRIVPGQRGAHSHH